MCYMKNCVPFPEGPGQIKETHREKKDKNSGFAGSRRFALPGHRRLFENVSRDASPGAADVRYRRNGVLCRVGYPAGDGADGRFAAGNHRRTGNYGRAHGSFRGDCPRNDCGNRPGNHSGRNSGDKIPGDKAPGDKAPGDKAPGDKAPEDRKAPGSDRLGDHRGDGSPDHRAGTGDSHQGSETVRQGSQLL